MKQKTKRMKRKTAVVEASCFGVGLTTYESCTGEEWDRESEVTREFIDFKDGKGCVYARKKGKS